MFQSTPLANERRKKLAVLFYIFIIMFQSTPLANERRKVGVADSAGFWGRFQSTPLANERRKRSTPLQPHRHKCFNPLLSRTRGERADELDDLSGTFVSIHSSREREEKAITTVLGATAGSFQSTPLANERRKSSLNNRSSFNGFDIHFRGLWGLFIFSG